MKFYTEEMLAGATYDDFAPLMTNEPSLAENLGTEVFETQVSMFDDNSEQIALDKAEEDQSRMNNHFERDLEYQVTTNSWKGQE